jgi:hypothetical protein
LWQTGGGRDKEAEAVQMLLLGLVALYLWQMLGTGAATYGMLAGVVLLLLTYVPGALPCFIAIFTI